MNKREWAKIDRLSKKIKAINFLGGKCEDCGETNVQTLEFHHKDENDKDCSIFELLDCRWSVIEKEISKCNLLCRNCHNKLHFGEDNVGRWKSNKKIFLEYKGVNVCEKCGYNECNASLDFHHINQNEKDFMLGDVSLRYSNIEDLTYKISNEIDKCVVLCKNCHILEHSDVEFFEKNKDVILNKSKSTKEVSSKIDRDIVIKLYENGMKQIDISKYFNVTKGTISNIIKELKLKNQLK